MGQQLRVEILADVAAYQAALAKAVGATESFGASMSAAGKKVAGVGKDMTRHITLPLVALGAVSTKMALDFEESMQRLRTGAGASQKEVDRMTESVEKMAKTARGGGQGPQKLAEALYMVESSGLRGRKALDVLSASAINATATGTDMTEVVNALTSAVKVQAAGTGNASKAMSVLNAIVGSGKMTFADLTAALRSGILPTAKQLGISLPEVGAALGVFTIQGVPAEAAATRLRTALSKMAAPVGASADALKVMGIGANDLAVMLQKGGLTGALELLHSKYEKLKDTKGIVEANKQLLLAFGGAKMGGTIMQLVQGWGLYQQTLNNVQKTSSDYAASAARVMDTPAAKIRMAIASLQTSMVQVGTALAPIIAKISSFIADLASKFEGLSPHTQKLIGFGLAAAAALGPLMSIIGNLIRLIGGLATALTVAFTTPWGAVLAAIGIGLAALAAGFIRGRQEAAALKGSFDAVQAAATTLATTFDTLKNANLSVAEAKANVVATSHQVEAALQAEKQASDGSSKSTLAEKQAHDNVVAAKLNHERAILTLNEATKAQTDAQDKASTATKNALQPILDFGNATGKFYGIQKELHGELDKSPSIFQKVQTATRGSTAEQEKAAKVAQEWGKGMELAGRQSFEAAVNATKMTPAGRASAEAMGLMKEAAGRFAQESGHVPSNIQQIVAEAKKVRPEEFHNAMTAWIKSAQKAGVDIPGWVKKAATQSTSHAQSLKSGVTGAISGLPAAGARAGSGLASGVANSIIAGTPAAVQAAADLNAKVKAQMHQKFGSTPDVWAKENVGSKLVLGIAQGIVESAGVVEGALAQHKQRLKAIVQAQDLIDLAKEWGSKIGIEHAMGIVKGLVQTTPTLKQQAVQQMKEMYAEQRKAAAEAVATSKADMISAFSDMANAALAAFDAKMAAWKPPASQLLEQMKLEDQVKQLTSGFGDNADQVADAERAFIEATATGNQAAIDSAQERLNAWLLASYRAVDQQQAALVAQAQARLAEAQAAGDPDALKQAQDNYDKALADQTAALKTAYDNARTLAEANLQYRADAEQRMHDAIAVKQREGLAKQLAELQTWLLKHPAHWAEMAQKVQTVLTRYNIQLVNQGRTWANKFASGIVAGIPAAVVAAKKYAAAVAKYMPHSPAEKGPLSFDPYRAGADFMAALSSGMTSVRVPAPRTTGIGSAAIVTPTAGALGGGVVVNVTVQGALLGSTVPQVADTIYRELVRKSKNNGGNLGLA